MNLSEETKKAFENNYLKDIYPEVDHRRNYANKKLQTNKIHQHPVVVRIQPHPKTKLFHIFITMVVEKTTKMAELNNHLHKKILKMNSALSLYFIQGTKIVSLSKQVGDFITKDVENQGIVYFMYSDEDPF